MIFPNSLLTIFLILSSESDNNYIVGGSVRDYLIGKEPNDFDLVSDIPYERLVTLFNESDWELNETGKEFLVLRVSKYFPIERYDAMTNTYFYEDERIEYEIANFRSDGKSFSDGRRPDQVEIGDMATDSERRDFTINALYMNPMTMDIIDPTGQGIEDVENRTLRFIGNAKKRIQEDYLRVFRAYRFSSKGFKPTNKTRKVVREMFNKAYEVTAPERVRMEIEKMSNL